MELGGLWESARAWPAVTGSVAHPAEHSGGVRRAIVKIYHGRNTDHRVGLWRASQEEADKET
ncbi:hypothetical protein SHKM778_82970 [Streptomyces sp. KM77-8]|uniref:Uncharacterized protein n=1 Tax=Streptomyces haneummycinicus TaxID=3074435 RepID=A0AAT9HWB3_9ACTN